jgi:NAD(P)-dependent dehydrogenase (short-subunit alcohol dehydrogenase family)
MAPKLPSVNLQGRTCMVTGASSGLGRVTALELARMGARVILVCRNPSKGEVTVAEIREQVGSANLDLMIADLSLQAEVRKLASDFLARGEPLHVLINNAGLVNFRRRVAGDGIEETFAVNHIAYFMLTLLLLDRITASAPARIINVSSTVHRMGAFDFDDLSRERNYGPMNAYAQSKLANILFTYELARRLAGTNVTVNCLHPGSIATGLGANNGLASKIVMPLLRPFMKGPEQGALTQIYLASSPEVEGVTGKYFVNCNPAKSSEKSYDCELARRLWAASAKLCAVDLPR